MLALSVAVVAAGAASMAPRVSRAIVLRPPSESDTGHIASVPDDIDNDGGVAASAAGADRV